jgi:hypothetical protein
MCFIKLFPIVDATLESALGSQSPRQCRPIEFTEKDADMHKEIGPVTHISYEVRLEAGSKSDALQCSSPFYVGTTLEGTLRSLSDMSFFDGYGICESTVDLRLFRNGRLGFTPCLLDASTFMLVLVGALSSIFIFRRRANKSAPKEAATPELNCPLNFATLQSRLFFNWASPLLKAGYAAGITKEDLWDLCNEVFPLGY